MRKKFAKRLRKQIEAKGANIFLEDHLQRGKGWWTNNRKRTAFVTNFVYDGQMFMVCERDPLAAYRVALDRIKHYDAHPREYLWMG